MQSRKRYTPEQKEQMKKRALDMLGQGKTQKETAEKLGTTVTTLRGLLKNENYPGKRGSRRAAAGGAAASPLSGVDSSSPVVQLALKQQRVKELEEQLAALQEEKSELESEMKSLYEDAGKQIFRGGKR